MFVPVLISAPLLVMLAVLLLNIIFGRIIYRLSSSPADVSILIPARNEERSIKECVESCLSQSGVSEIIVIDDNSTDRTRDMVLEIEDPRVRLLSGRALPAGWLGKNFACQQLGEVATGSYLLFLDADARLYPGATERAVGILDTLRSDLLSFFPEQRCGSIPELLAIPLVDLFLYLTLPLPFVPLSTPPSMSAANGQFMLFRTDFYRKLGGHQSVSQEIIEDVALARRTKEKGGRVVVTSGRGSVWCRMYSGRTELELGFEKNAFQAFGRSTLRMSLFLLLVWLIFLLPIIGLLPFIGMVLSPAFVLPSILILVVRGVHAWAFGYSLFWSVVAHPLALVYGTAIILRSRVAFLQGVVQWKGRGIG